MGTNGRESGHAGERRVSRACVGRALAVAGRYERTLWTLVALSLLGDVVLTGYGLQQGLTESNPVVRAVIDTAGFTTFGALKLGAVGAGVAIWVRMSVQDRAVVPLGLALPWLAATLVNAAVVA